MDTVTLTLRCPPDDDLDLQLPLDTPLARLVPALVDGLNLRLGHAPAYRAADGPTYTVRWHETGRLLSGGQSLRQAGVPAGAILSLTPGAPAAVPVAPRPCPPVLVKLPCLQAVDTCQVFDCHGQSAIVGRGRDADINLETLPEGHLISRRHLRLSHRRGQWYVRDMGSRHGTWLNDEQLAAEQEALLANGDRLRLGPAGPALVFYLP